MNDDAKLPNPGLHEEHGESHGRKRRSPQIPMQDNLPAAPGKKKRSPQDPTGMMDTAKSMMGRKRRSPQDPTGMMDTAKSMMGRKRRSNDENNHNLNEDENSNHSS